MAKKVVSTYLYPSRFGSHKSMVSPDKKADLESCLKVGLLNPVICVDEYGEYITEVNRLDNGLSDPNRTDSKRLGKLFGGIKREDPKAGKR